MQKKIPFEVQAPQNSATEDFKKAFYALRESARQNGLQDMTLDEINEEIRQARIERAKKEKASSFSDFAFSHLTFLRLA